MRAGPTPPPKSEHPRPARWNLRFDRCEAAGALGDLGTFVPLLVGMVYGCGLPLAPALFLAGLMNVITGLTFGIPMPVQPMKAIAAVAISEGLMFPQIAAAGLITGAVILLLGVTGLVDWLSRVVPRPVVRGIQLAIGLKLLTRGLADVAGTYTSSGSWFGWDSVATGAACFALVMFFYFSRRVPGAIVIFAVGVAALFASRPELARDLRLGFGGVTMVSITAADWESGFLNGALPQIPLTLLNSVVAVCALSRDLFPDRPASPRRVAVSVGLMNLLCCPFGGMPMCHGTGGLAGQYRFGARTGGSVVILGVAKMTLALLFGASLLTCLIHFPQSVLGVLLMFSGLELGLVCRDQNTSASFFIMLLTAGACMALNIAVGCVLGWAMALLWMWGVFPGFPTPTPGPRPPA